MYQWMLVCLQNDSQALCFSKLLQNERMLSNVLLQICFKKHLRCVLCNNVKNNIANVYELIE